MVLRPAPAFAGSSSVPPARQGLLRLPRSRHLSPDLSRLRLHAWRLQRFPRAAGFYSAVAEQSSLARRPSSRALYQVRWSISREWYHNNGHSVSRPTLAKVADFLYWLRYTRGLSVSSLSGYRSVLSAVFRFHLPSLSSDPVIRDLLLLLPTLFGGACAASPCLGLVYGVDIYLSRLPLCLCLRLPSALSR